MRAHKRVHVRWEMCHVQDDFYIMHKNVMRNGKLQDEERRRERKKS